MSAVRVPRKTRFREPLGIDRVTFVIRGQNHHDVLPRVVMLFHRLNVAIDCVHMTRRAEWRSLLMTVTTHANIELARRMQANLYKLVSVKSVKLERDAKNGPQSGAIDERVSFLR